MMVAGIDPGSRRAGFAVIEVELHKVRIVEMGVWDLMKLSINKDKADLGERFEILHDHVKSFFTEHNPHIIGLEKVVSFKNIESAHKLSEARGVIRLAAYQSLQDVGARLIELSPTAIKRQTTGFGSSQKQGVYKALSLRFSNLSEFASKKVAHDAFDALGVAWTAWIHYKQRMPGRAGLLRLQRINREADQSGI
jgi:crossover junction endodeoxyribonuclease RuvC